VNFAKIRTPGTLEYRTYERAIDRETLACGSGAVAAVMVSRWLELLSHPQITLWPHRCRRHRSGATLTVAETDAGFALLGHPLLVYSGVVARCAFA
jgi:diaminopimelate epimerase